MLTDQDKLKLHREFKDGATVPELARKYFLGEREVHKALDETREALGLAPTAPTLQEENPMADPEAKHCTVCGTKLRSHNRSGLCTEHRKPTKKAAKKAKRKATKRTPKQVPSVPVEVAVLPEVTELPADYLADCIAEARRRVNAADRLQDALEG